MTSITDESRASNSPLVVGLGEAMIRLSASGRIPLPLARELDVAVAGSELNMLATARALGTSARWLTRLPANDFGEMMRRHAVTNGVEVVAHDEPGARAGLFFLEVGAPPRPSSVLYDRADSAASHMSASEFDWDDVLRDAVCAHVTGVTCALGEGPLSAAIAFLESARRLGVMTSFDMNYRSRLWPTADALVAFRRVLPLVDTLFVAPGDIALLAQSDHSAEGLAERVVVEYGTTTLVIRERHELSPYELGVTVKVFGDDDVVSEASGVVVDELGAGDAAAGAFLASTILGDKISLSVERCARAYARMLTIPGDTWSGSVHDQKARALVILDELEERLMRARLVAIVRLADNRNVVEIVDTLCNAGVEFLEITVERPEGFDSLERVLSEHAGRAVIGAGTVLSADAVRRVAALGAQFIVSPNTDAAVIKAAHGKGLLALPGAFSATEVATATAHGARFVKLFPANVGVEYLRALRGPFPRVKFVPTGGVSAENAQSWLDAGAVALAMGSSLVRKSGDMEGLFDRAQRAVRVTKSEQE